MRRGSHILAVACLATIDNVLRGEVRQRPARVVDYIPAVSEG
jgi:hypothetical protein